jgi:hypothetical protein
MTPAMKFRVTGIARDGQKKSIPQDSQSLALRDAKSKKVQGWEDVQVEIWQNGSFQVEPKAAQALAKVPSTKSNENAEIALANLIAHGKTAYLSAKKNTLDEQQLSAFATQCMASLLDAGMKSEDLLSMLESTIEAVHA